MLRWNVIVARLLLASALSAAWATIATTSHAAVTTYFGGPAPSKLDLTNPNVARNAFLATLSSFGVENLESLGGQQHRGRRQQRRSQPRSRQCLLLLAAPRTGADTSLPPQEKSSPNLNKDEGRLKVPSASMWHRSAGDGHAR